MKMSPKSISVVLSAGLVSASLVACGGSNQEAETADAIEDANEAEAEAEEEQYEEKLEAEEEIAEEREDNYEDID